MGLLIDAMAAFVPPKGRALVLLLNDGYEPDIEVATFKDMDDLARLILATVALHCYDDEELRGREITRKDGTDQIRLSYCHHGHRSYGVIFVVPSLSMEEQTKILSLIPAGRE